MAPRTTTVPRDDEQDGAQRSEIAAPDRRLARVLHDTLEYARERDYAGWDYSDGTSSRFRQWLPVESKWLNVAFQETVKRAPVNLRPLLLVEQRRNYMGAALFAMAHWNVHRGQRVVGVDEAGGAGETRDETPVDHRAETRRLLDWLVETRRRGYSGFCGGHNHRIQQLDCLVEAEEPDVVDTSFAVKALLRGSSLGDEYADIARTAPAFVVEDLDYRECEDGATISYHPTEPGDHYTLNAGGLAARLFLDLYDRFETTAFRERATALLDYIAARQTAVGGWMYRDPPSASHLSMDNHHNGFVLECLLRYREVTGSDRYDETIREGLRFYRDVLFEADGAPNWDESDAYPRDVHASAVGALVFTYAGDLAFARRILEWAVEQLYAGDGRFYYRKHRRYTKKITLMRWCQAWMAYALSEYLAAREGEGGSRTLRR